MRLAVREMIRCYDAVAHVSSRSPTLDANVEALRELVKGNDTQQSE